MGRTWRTSIPPATHQFPRSPHIFCAFCPVPSLLLLWTDLAQWISLSGDWCLCTVLGTDSGAHHYWIGYTNTTIHSHSHQYTDHGRLTSPCWCRRVSRRRWAAPGGIECACTSLAGRSVAAGCSAGESGLLVWMQSPAATQPTLLHTHTHTHPFNGPFSGTTQVSRYQKGGTNLDFTEARDSEWQWHQLGQMQVCTLLQTDNHTSIPPLIPNNAHLTIIFKFLFLLNQPSFWINPGPQRQVPKSPCK